eukprot:TRINITY_DN320_c0_g5_i1.p1 TRINITY_DN320_c0_g5~~TRINITY_DN320_c0_g5_i1.p1  ORF type:complete len:325 (-),score=62.28 TRINITY_DN320_c0_g5_i1:2025-2999(-)
MMAQTAFWTTLGLLALIINTSTASGQATENPGCQITDTMCACLEVESSKLCMQHQGNNQCLLGSCKPSYRCDCLGYEMCKRNSCSLYTTDTNVIPSEEKAFGCHLTVDAGSCTSFDYVMETVDAAMNAHTEVDTANDEAMLLSMEAYKIVASIEADVIAMNDVLKSVESVRSYMSLEESIEIEKDAELMVNLVLESGRVAGMASENAAAVYKASREVAILKGEAIFAEKEADKVEKQLAQKQKDADNNGRACDECKGLKADVDKLRTSRREAARKAGEAAKNSREKRRNAAKHRQAVEDNRDKAKDAKDRLISAVERIKKRAAI